MDVARQAGVNEGPLSNWVRQYRDQYPVTEKPLTVLERVRLQELEKEVRGLGMKAEFLGKVAAFFAQARR